MPALETRFDYYMGQVTPTFVTVSRALTAGAGLAGGGNLSADRTFDVGAGTGISVAADAVALDTSHVRNVDHSAVTLTAGGGLTGGGTIESSRSFAVGAGAGITVNADDVALDTSSARNTDHSGVTLTAGAGLTGGGDISASRSFALDTSSARNTDHSGVTLTAGAGLTGGGDISASRSFAVGAGTGITVNADDVALTLATAAGTYTPTLTNVGNITASTAYACQYMQVGSVVTVSGRVDVDPTAAAMTTLGISLPIASNLAAQNECAGVAFCGQVAGQGAAIVGDAGNNRAQMQWTAVDLANREMWFTYTYKVI